jgi:recombination protein RecR
MNTKFKQTAKLFQKLPGVGPRQAARFILALLNKDESELRELGNAISNLKKEISFCKTCFNISAALEGRASPAENGREGFLCHICSDPRRDTRKLLVVEKVTDLDSIEKTGLYKGLYHVLGGAINPLDGATPETLRFRELAKRVDSMNNEHKNIELIIATNPSTTGETTALYIKGLFLDKPDITLTRLGRGLASGSNLEYADELTLKHALESRK